MAGEMVNASGPLVVDLARAVNACLDEPLRKGMDPEVAIAVVLSVAVDMHRLNYGDRACKKSVRDFVEQRLSKSPEYWGVSGRREGGQ